MKKAAFSVAEPSLTRVCVLDTLLGFRQKLDLIIDGVKNGREVDIWEEMFNLDDVWWAARNNVECLPGLDAKLLREREEEMEKLYRKDKTACEKREAIFYERMAHQRDHLLDWMNSHTAADLAPVPVAPGQ